MDFLKSRVVPAGLLVCMAIGWVSLRTNASWAEIGPGAGLVPKIVVGLVALLSAAVLILGDDAEPDEEARPDGAGRPLLIYAVVLPVIGIALPYLGFILPLAVCTVAIMRFAERKPWLISIAYGAATSLAVVAIFNFVLRVPLSDGPVERLLRSVLGS